VAEVGAKEEFYRWIGTLDTETQKLRIYTMIRFLNDLFVSLETEIMVERQGYPMKTATLALESDDPDEYFEIVMGIMEELFKRMKPMEEEYVLHIHF